VFELSLPRCKFTNYFLDFVSKYAYFLLEVIFNICVKKFLRSFVCLLN